MSRTIICIECSIPLGEVRDAKLKKGLVYMCEDCNTKRIALKMMHNKPNNSPTSNFNDIFGDILGDKT